MVEIGYLQIKINELKDLIDNLEERLEILDSNSKKLLEMADIRLTTEKEREEVLKKLMEEAKDRWEDFGKRTNQQIITIINHYLKGINPALNNRINDHCAMIFCLQQLLQNKGIINEKEMNAIINEKWDFIVDELNKKPLTPIKAKLDFEDKKYLE